MEEQTEAWGGQGQAMNRVIWRDSCPNVIAPCRPTMDGSHKRQVAE